MLTPETLKLAAISSIFLLVASIGLQTRLGSTLRVFTDRSNRRKALGALSAMFIATPVLAWLVVRIGGPGAPAAAALLALAISPMAPFLPRKQWKVGGDAEWVTALQVAATLLSVALAPVYLAIFSRAFDMSVEAPVAGMMKVLTLTVLAPLGLGLLVRGLAPDLAARLVRPVGLIGTAVLAAVVLLILVGVWPALAAAAATQALPAAVLLAVGGVVLGHVLTPGPAPDKTSAAMAAVSRHPGVAIVLASAALGGAPSALLGSVLLFLLVGTLVLAVYQVGSGSQGE
jgi:BASS family bile acid:Na+ symporter